MNKIKAILFGDGPWAHNLLKDLLRDKSISIKMICGRYKTQDKLMRKISYQNDIEFIKPKNINQKKYENKIKKLSPDLMLSMSYDQIFKKKLINLPKLGIINCHAGKLPEYRGRNVLNWVLINGEKKFGITVHYINQKIDDGHIIIQKTYAIKDIDTYATLLGKSYVECPKLMIKAINLIKKNKVVPIKQKNILKKTSYYSKRKKGDERVNWNQPSKDIFNFLRGISMPGPMGQSIYKNRFLKMNQSRILKRKSFYSKTNEKPGTIIFSSPKKLVIKTSDGYLEVFDYKCSIKVDEGFILK